MQLTSRALALAGENIALLQALTTRAAFGGRIGILPVTPFKCEASFVRGSLEVEIDCMAVSPSGVLLQVSDHAVVRVPKLDPGEHYLGVGLGSEMSQFEVEETPFERPVYNYVFCSLEEVRDKDLVPVLKFKVDGGTLSICPEYIAPFFTASSDPRIRGFANEISDSLKKLVDHPNLTKIEARRALLNYAFLLGTGNLVDSVAEISRITKSLASSLKHYINGPFAEADCDIPELSLLDIQKWFSWLKSYLELSFATVEKVVIEDEKIDIDDLKAQIKAELSQEIMDQVNTVVDEKVSQLRDGLKAEIEEVLKDFVSGAFRQRLHDDLQGELSPQLYSELYDSLYQALSEMFEKRKEGGESTYIPLI